MSDIATKVKAIKTKSKTKPTNKQGNQGTYGINANKSSIKTYKPGSDLSGRVK